MLKKFAKPMKQKDAQWPYWWGRKKNKKQKKYILKKILKTYNILK